MRNWKLHPRQSWIFWLFSACSLVLTAEDLAAEDWPEWRGHGRLGVWTEDGILERFPEKGLSFTWRTPLRGGYSGPAVAAGRVFVTDFHRSERTRGTERVLALDENTGNLLWSHNWPVDYAGLEPRYAIGPRATPTVDGDRVTVLGAMGKLIRLDVRDGKVIWQKDFVKEYGTEIPVWGMSGAPLVDGSLLICLVGGKEGAKVVAFDKVTGREVWRSIDASGEPGYGPPILFEAAGKRQLIQWHPQAISSLDPRSGKVLWEEPFEVALGLTVATPVFNGKHLLVSSFFKGSMLLDLSVPKAKRVWKGRGKSEIDTEGLHALITTPVIAGDTIYGVGSYGEMRGIDLATGERLWESRQPVVEKARWAAAFLVPQGDRYFISNDRGELIIARLDRKGYHEIDRTELIEPTSPTGRRERGAVHWSHPAYANRHIVVRNDKEILRASLAKPSNKVAGSDRSR